MGKSNSWGFEVDKSEAHNKFLSSWGVGGGEGNCDGGKEMGHHLDIL